MKFALVSGTSINHSPYSRIGRLSRSRRNTERSGCVRAAIKWSSTGTGPGPRRCRHTRLTPGPILPRSPNWVSSDVVSFNSVGSLRPSLAPGTLLSCSDYVAIQQPPATYHDEALQAGAPGIANNLVPGIVAALAPEFSVATGQTYVHTRGPRFETRAEIRVMKAWGDVVGMTLAPEADLCTELGLRYNSFGMVDNYANGIEGAALDYASFKQMVLENQERVNRFIARLLEFLSR